MSPRLCGLIAGLACLLTLSLSAQAPHNGPVSPGLYVWRLVPPPEYQRWYQAMEKCSGMKGAYKRVSWLMVAAPWIDGQRHTHGSWQGDNDNGTARITVNALESQDSTLVTHEALHDILWRNGWKMPALPDWASDTDSIEAKHPKPLFGTCAPTYYEDPRPTRGS